MAGSLWILSLKSCSRALAAALTEGSRPARACGTFSCVASQVARADFDVLRQRLLGKVEHVRAEQRLTVLAMVGLASRDHLR